MASQKLPAPGPLRTHHVGPGSRYELVDGHPVYCAPTGRDGSGAVLDGGRVIQSDPKVKRAGIDPGFAPDDLNLRAPDVAIIPESGPPGWIPGVPAFAIEYAGVGQDEGELQSKIGELLARGTQVLWVVRLVGPRRVEVHEPGVPMRVVSADGILQAPAFLENDVPAEALWNAEAADRVTLRNLLARFGYRDPDDIRQEGREEGRHEGREEGREEGRHEGRRHALLTILDARGWVLDAVQAARVQAERDPARLDRWIARAAVATVAEGLLDD